MEELNKVENTEEIKATELPAETKDESLGRKILKWGLRGLAIIGTYVAGVITGRLLGKSDDDSDESDQEEPAA